MKADWHQLNDSSALTDGDPFAGVGPMASANFSAMSGDQTTLGDLDTPVAAVSNATPVDEDRGYYIPPISVEDGVATLRDRLGQLVQREARLDSIGITCPLKDCEDMTCLACPFTEAGNDEERKAALCQIGQQQEIVLAHLLAAKSREGEPVGV